MRLGVRCCSAISGSWLLLFISDYISFGIELFLRFFQLEGKYHIACLSMIMILRNICAIQMDCNLGSPHPTSLCCFWISRASSLTFF